MTRLIIFVILISFCACKEKSQARSFSDSTSGSFQIQNDLGRKITLENPQLEKVVKTSDGSQALEYKICIKSNGDIAYLEIVGKVSDINLVREVAQILREYKFNSVSSPDEECGRIKL